MAKRRTANLGELAIAIALKTQALEQGLKEVEKKLKTHGKNVQNTGKDYDKLAVVAGLALWKIVSAIKSGTEAYNQFNNAMVGLRSIVQGTGNDFAKAQEFIEKYTKDGLVPASNAAQGLKNLLSRGMGFDQATEVMERFKDSAAFGRQGALSLGEAIQGATEGIKNSNSTMVDNAGVTENLSVMWGKYAETIGKTVNELTDAEKIQAEYVGILEATKFQVGDAAKYANEFAGSQAKTNAEILRLKQSFGSALVPALDELLKVLIPVISAFAEFVKNNPELVAATTIAATAFLGIVASVTAVGAAIKILTPALAALNTSLMALLTNPAVLALAALAGAVALITYNVNQARKEQEQYNQAVEKFAKIKAEGVSRQELPQLKEETQLLSGLIEQYDRLMDKYEELQRLNEGLTPAYMALEQAQVETGISAEQLGDSFRKLGLNISVYEGEIEEARKQLETMNEAIFEAERITSDEYSTQMKNIAVKRKSIEETKSLIDTYKTAVKGSKEWLEAQKALAEIFPQFSTASGIQIDAIEKITTAQEKATEAEWTLLQAKIRMTMMDIERIKAQKEATVKQYEEERKSLEKFSDMHKAVYGAPSPADKFLNQESERIKSQKEAVGDLNKEYETLKDLLSIDWDELTGITPLSLESYSGSEAANSAYYQALRLFDHRKHLNKLTVSEQIKALEEIKTKHAATSEEIMDIDERIYDAREALRNENKKQEEESLKEYLELVKKQEEALDDRTANSFRWIDRQKLYEKIDVDEEIAAYERIIKYHKEYMAKVLDDEKISQEEKQKIFTEETQFIQDQQDKIFSIRKSYIDKEIDEYMDAQKKKLSEEEKAEDERLRKKLSAIDREYDDAKQEKEAKDLTEKLKKLKDDEQKYLYARTKEGQDRLLSIQEEIAEVEEDIESQRVDKEKQSRKDAITQELEDNKTRYKKLREELETSRTEMLSETTKFAEEMANEQETVSETMASAVKSMLSTWGAENDSFLDQTLRKMQDFVTRYKQLMGQVTIGGALGLGDGSGGSIVVNVSDNGDKHIYSKDETIDYTKELFNTAKNAVRGG